MVTFYIGAGIGLVLAVVYLIAGTMSFLRIRRELIVGGWELDDPEGGEGATTPEAVAVVPGFSWKAGLAVLASFVILVIASYSGTFWYLMAFSGLGTAAAVIIAFVIELRTEHRAGTTSAATRDDRRTMVPPTAK
ncbi:hypothetical protein [Mycolicibacterium stellerae]|uniref:hypothetical protein n=1 Tax=Mycolicibacterium stellerae TaxID=2358193 RepID=UPI000F0B9119|nr:hypothetical protein [Mycolicibacterium stellerae]